MQSREGGQSRSRRSRVEAALQVLAAYAPEEAARLERGFREQPSPESRLALRESLAEALFEHDQDEVAVEVLSS